MRRVLPSVCAAALVIGTAVALAAAPTGGQIREVTMPAKVFVPGRLDVLVGDTVVWHNGDSTNHTVTADGGFFDSGYVAPGATFAQAFGKPGSYAYHCTIHKFMRGVVNVYALVLSGPGQPVISGGRVVLTGLVPAGTTEVVLEKIGGTAVERRRIVPSADGSFSVPVRAFAPAAYRALMGGTASRRVRVVVSPRVRLTVRGAGLVAVASPSRVGARAVLQIYERERFDWRTVARGRLEAGSRVAFSRAAGSTSARLRVVVRGRDGWADGASQTIVVGS